MKKWLQAAGVGIALMASSAVVNAAEQKIAVVDVASVFQQLPQREKVARQLESEFKSRASELQSLEKRIRDRMEKLQRDGSTMSNSDRTKAERDIAQMQADFNLKGRALEEDSRRRQAEERNKILRQVQDAVKAIANKEGYSAVIDTNAVVFARPDMDISSQVIKMVGNK